MIEYYCSLSNADAKTKLPARELFSNDPEAIAAFIAAEDRPERGVFKCISRLQDGATRRTLETVAEVDEIFIDQDFKGIEEDADTVRKRVRALPLEPSAGISSGHGLHVIYKLAEPVAPNDPELAHVRRQLTELLCGDPAVAHNVALRRAPGSHNTKFGDRWPVTTLWDNGKTYRLDEIEDMLADIEHPILTRKGKSNGHSAGDGFAAAATGEWKDPIDVEARLAAMEHGGTDGNGVNVTERDVIASELRRGTPLNEAVEYVLNEVMKKHPERGGAARGDRSARCCPLPALRHRERGSVRLSVHGQRPRRGPQVRKAREERHQV
jgi:putative DNA primase/helicase